MTVETMSERQLADRGAAALHAAAQCIARGTSASILGNAKEARKELAEARALVRTARDCSRAIGDDQVRDACDRAVLLLGVLGVAVGA